jgi:hypothetical protein
MSAKLRRIANRHKANDVRNASPTRHGTATIEQYILEREAAWHSVDQLIPNVAMLLKVFKCGIFILPLRSEDIYYHKRPLMPYQCTLQFTVTVEELNP